ncbi:MAG: hypothetical protein LBT29_03620 [Flavobacteriaceae bacterium]|jgi:hypothetical protein|nr:hypothetical protein [Flavobacteriaceae bacterium]
MEKELNSNLVSKILERIPKNVKPVQYIMEVLGLSSESVYRRIRSDICFTFNEAVKLASILDFSMDSVIGQENKTGYAFTKNNISHSSNAFLSMMNQYSNLIHKKLAAEESETTIVLNHMLPVFTVYFDTLFKFFYYKWIDQTHEVSLNTPFSDIVLPQEIVSLQKELDFYSRKISNIVFIIDQNVFLMLIKEVQYYYRRKLVSDEELELLKADIFKMIDFTEKMTQESTLDSKEKIFIFLSALNIKTNSCQSSCDGSISSYFWLYSVKPLVTHEPELYDQHKQWIKYLKKHSVFITHSNELMRAEFFNKQREFLNEMLNAQELKY